MRIWRFWRPLVLEVGSAVSRTGLLRIPLLLPRTQWYARTPSPTNPAGTRLNRIMTRQSFSRSRLLLLAGQWDQERRFAHCLIACAFE